jgi:hypothetical protein
VLFAGSVLAGLGVGGMMTGSLLVVLSRVTSRNYDGVSTLWNVTVDAGLAIGGVGLGVVSLAAGEDRVFAAAAIALAVSIPLAVGDSRRSVDRTRWDET